MRQCINSRDNERVKHAAKLAASPALRSEEGLFFAEGPRLCIDLAATLSAKCLFATAEALEAWPAAEPLFDEVFEVSAPVAEKLGATRTPQGMFGLFEMQHAGFGDLDYNAGLLVCENVQDPANIGAMMRSAAGLGLGGAVLVGACADVYSSKVLRAGMGAVGRLPVVRCATMAEAAIPLKAAGVALYAAALGQPLSPGSAQAGGRFALLIGNEGAGLSEEALLVADERLSIPMANGVESLNAAAAAAILMYHFKFVL